MYTILMFVVVMLPQLGAGENQSGPRPQEPLPPSSESTLADQDADEMSIVDPVVEAGAPEAVKEQVLGAVPLAEFDARAHDQIWQVSSRSVWSRGSASECLVYRRRTKTGQWVDETADRFIAANEDGLARRVLFYVHGNRSTHQDAIRAGLATYDQTFLDWKGAPPVRFVIWSWPSEQVRGLIADIRTKADRAEQHAFHFAKLLGQMDQHPEISIIGYSYGARLTVNALHLLGGGSVEGHRLESAARVRPKINVTLVAAAIRNDCLCNKTWLALTQINHLFLMYNSRDQFLRFYKLARFDDKTPALGFTGLRSYRSGFLHASQIEQFDASKQVGREHAYLAYVVDREIERLIRENIFAGGL